MWKGQCGQLVKSVVVLESLRAIGLAVLSFHVFPQLDLARCLVLSACFPLVAVLQRSLVAMVSAARTGRSFRNRLGRCFVAIPHVIMFLVLMSSCYVWALFDNKFTAIIALPIGVICTSAGFWESWIDTTHSGTSFDELYRLKYAVRKMNTTTKLIVSLMRIVCTVSVLVSIIDFFWKKNCTYRYLLSILTITRSLIHLILSRHSLVSVHGNPTREDIKN